MIIKMYATLYNVYSVKNVVRPVQDSNYEVIDKEGSWNKFLQNLHMITFTLKNTHIFMYLKI